MKTYQVSIYSKVLLLMLFSLSSCKKSFLEIDPKGKLIAKTTNDYNLLLNNIYYDVTGVDGQVFSGDEVTVAKPYYDNMSELRGQRYFQYRDDVYDPVDDGKEITALTKQLYTYNVIINEVMDSEDGTAQNKLRYKGEAMVNRAWIYLMLVNYYGKPYTEASAGTDPGFPIITTSDVTRTQFERASVKAVYDFMITDLQTAIPDLPISAENRTRVCRAAAEALLGKIYLFMGKYAEGLIQLNNAFSHLPTAYPVKLYDYNLTLGPGGAWAYNAASSPLTFILGEIIMPDNAEVLFLKQTKNNYTSFLTDLLLAKQAYELYGSSDQRLKFYSRYGFGGAAIKTPDVYRKIGTYNAQLGMSLPEMYLLSAELKARTGDIGGAKADLETFRAKRMPAGAATVNVTDPVAMLRYVIDERTREFALQGFRWFDMRRLSVDPIFLGTTYSHKVLSETGATLETFTLRPERLTFKIPKKILLANPGMNDNP